MFRWQSRNGNTCVSRNPGDDTPPLSPHRSRPLFILRLSRTWLRFPSLAACNYLTFHNSYKLITQYRDKYLLTTHTHTRYVISGFRGRAVGVGVVQDICNNCNNIVDLFLASGENYFITAKLPVCQTEGVKRGFLEERLENN